MSDFYTESWIHYHCPAHYVIGPFRNYRDCPLCAKPDEPACSCFCYCTSRRRVGFPYCSECLAICHRLPVDIDGEMWYNGRPSRNEG